MNLFSVCGILPKKCHVAPSPLDTLTTPRATRGIAHYTRTGDIPPSPGIIQPAPSAGWERRGIQLPQTDMFGSSGNTYPENIRSRRFNFPGQTCPNHSVTLTRRTSAADDSASPGSLIRQKLVIRRIHFRPQSKSKLWQYWRSSLLNRHSSLMQDTLNKTFPNLLILPDTSPVLKIINWGDIRRLNTPLTAVTSHYKRHNYFATLWVAIMTMGPASTTRPYSLTHI